MKYLTGKDYDHLCSECQMVITCLVCEIKNLDDIYVADEEGPCNAAYDYSLFCGGHTCKESK